MVEKMIQVADGLGDADASQVMAGATFTSETGFKQEGKFVPSAGNITFDDTKAQLGVKTTQEAIDKNAENIAANAAAIAINANAAATAESKAGAAQDTADNHIGNKLNPHGVTATQVGLGNVNNTADADKPVSTAQQDAIDAAYANSNYYTDEKIAALINGAPTTLDTLKEISDAMAESQDVVAALNDAIGTKANETEFNSHVTDKSNPHGVTATQVGLGNVPNVATNDQTPTYTAASSNTALKSGEKLSVAMGKIARAVSSLISHLANKSNPHEVTATQVGLGNVNNTADADKPVSTAQQAALDDKVNGLCVYYPTDKSADDLLDFFALIPCNNTGVNAELAAIIGGSYAYVMTLFYSSKTTTARRVQIGFSYNSGVARMATRSYQANGWTPWVKVDNGGFTANRALITDANGNIAISPVTATELSYLDGVTSAIQTQLNDLASVKRAGAAQNDLESIISKTNSYVFTAAAGSSTDTTALASIASGVQIKKTGYYDILIDISVNADDILNVGYRNFVTSSNYSDITKRVHAKGYHHVTYHEIGVYIEAGTYIRPILSGVIGGGDIGSCALNVIKR